ncbi:MAG: alginate export family protein, partial [Candidatus Omnitrophica bacterium]|nr:alginate export family protein [Candidatus Omnitrophota bacterium]
MKKWYILFFYIILFLPIPKLFAQPDDFNFSAGGEERFRIEFRNNFDFNKDADDKGYLAFQRLRINSKLTYKKTLTLFVEGMDLREFCDGIKKTGQADEFDLNQAYLEYKNSLARIKIGRQELSYGDERII